MSNSDRIGSSRLGFRGVEDLGGGMRAEFWLEAGVANDSGAGSATNSNNQAVTGLASAGTQGLTFNRKSTVGLVGSMGEFLWVVTTLPSSILMLSTIRLVQTVLHPA